MRKIGLILDSASGYSKAELNKKGHAFIPLQISVNGDVKKAGIDITLQEIYKAMEDKKNVEIKTSLPTGNDIEAAFDWILERCEKAIYISISARLSGTNNAARTVQKLNDKYMERIYIHDSEYSSPWSNIYLEDFERLINEYDDIEEIEKILNLANPHMFGVLAPGDIYWFYKGGRISKTQYIAGSLLKVKPILTLENGTLNKDKIEKARGIPKAIAKMVEMIEPKVNELKEKGIPFKIMNMASSDPSFTDEMAKKIEEKYGVPRSEQIIMTISQEQTAHMGPASCGTGIFVSLFDLIEYEKGNK